MNPIQPRTPVAEMPATASTEFAATPAEITPTNDPAIQALAKNEGDWQARFAELFGAPQSHVLYADKRGSAQLPQASYAATRTAPAVDLVGTPLSGAGSGVKVSRQLGDKQGYESKNHAIAWARAAGHDNAMVVNVNGRWHAVVTNKPAKGFEGAGGRITEGVQLGKVDRAKYDAMHREAKAAQGPEREAKWKALASYALGIPESEIHVVFKGEQPVSGKVNINLSPDFNAEGRAARFDPKTPPWIQLGPAAFDRPANVFATLAHEEVHAGHRKLTAHWYAEYQREQPGIGFRNWMSQKADALVLDPTSQKNNAFLRTRLADVVAGYQDGTYGPTELEAHVEAARVAFASGDLEQARTDLRKINSLEVAPKLQTEELSKDVLRAMRDKLPADARKVFDEVVKEAKPGSALRKL